uniref:Uncharacterized protein n=1 Tax=Siphoviridae sp. ctJLl6 TaxID=2827836 RepID=A0A8S5SC33_9CAUD|nr:MAG TPA: hypothetical protein [Siphoviridae sp. ctJLl6]
MISVEKIFQDYAVLIPTLVIVSITAMVAFQFIWNLFEDILVNKLGIQTKWGRKKREEHELLIKTAESLNKLQETHEKDIERIDSHDEEIKEELVNFTTELRQTLKTQNEKMNKFSDSVNKISDKLDKMKIDTDMRFQENEEKQNKKEQAKIKSEISNRYSIYHERKWITNIEFEALEGLIAAYEAFGGLNSFVHSIVQKEMFTWRKIDEEEKLSD